MRADDPHDLLRFVDAQQPVYAQVLAELAAGAKTSHWMWFVFPQLQALGHSAMARHYGIASLAEAQAYASHPLLGRRLLECSEQVLRTRGLAAEQIFGSVDAMKLRSCMTLFERAAPQSGVFARLLERFYAGRRDEASLRLLGPLGPPAG